MKLKWQVAPKPTGAFRSFERRGWPSATWNGYAAVQLTCDEEYVPSIARLCKHLEITIMVAQHNIREKEPEGPAFRWRTLKKRASSLDEAKEMAEDFLNRNLYFMPKEAQ